jgi:hypothetical protein
MLRVKTTVIAGLLSLVAVNAMAGGIVGTVAVVLTRASDGLTYTVINGTASGQPACATHSYFMIMNETSAVGVRQYAMLLAAQASGLSVAITGNNTCTRWGDGEDINAISIQD